MTTNGGTESTGRKAVETCFTVLRSDIPLEGLKDMGNDYPVAYLVFEPGTF
jgi:hypothetical protein